MASDRDAAGARSSDPALTISVGELAGTVALCQDAAHVCETVLVASLDELDAALRITDDEFDGAVPNERVGDLVLAGEPGRWKRPGYPPQSSGGYGIGPTSGGGNCLGCPGVLYHAYAIKDGRPIVLSWDFWTLAFEAFNPSYSRHIIESLRVLD